MNAIALASDGLLGGSPLSIATNGHIGIIVQMPRRRPKGGSGVRKRETPTVVIPKQKVVYKPYDDSEEIILLMTII